MSGHGVRVIHAIAPWSGGGPLAERQRLFLESVDEAGREGVIRLAVADGGWQRAGWTARRVRRDATSVGDHSDKPFLRDLFDFALELAGPADWLLYSNVDCAFAPDLYRRLRDTRGVVVEYMRRDVEGEPSTLRELFENAASAYPHGIDAMALRAGFYEEVREHLPDFIIGEPHWDTIYSGVLRRLTPVRRETELLFHPRHQQVWHLGRPTLAGKHNHYLYEASLNYGYSEKSMIGEEPEGTDTAVIAAVFGEDPRRAAVNASGIREHLKQDLYADYYLIEMAAGGRESFFPADLLDQVIHIRRDAPEPCLDLFQKEALFNIGWREALRRKRYDYFLFVDADVYSVRPDWFRKMRDRLREDPGRAVQGFRVVQDTEDPQLQYSSLAAAFVLNRPTDLTLNPGLCWGLHRSLLEMGDGFNPYCGDAGDSAFVAEYLNTPEAKYDPWLYRWSWFREIERDLPYRAELDCVPFELRHINHGPLVDRHYETARYALDGFPPLRELLEVNAQGLVAWRDPDCAERRILRRRACFTSTEAVDRIFAEFGYTRYPRVPAVAHRTPRAKDRFRPAGERTGAFHWRPLPPGAPREASGELNVFRPQEIYREEFPFSWCDRIRKPDGSTYIPQTMCDGVPTLVLDGLPDSRYMVCALPVQANWEPLDLAPYTRLHMTVQASAEMRSDVCVALVSRAEDGAEAASAAFSLCAAGLEPCRRVPFTIPLSAFAADGFDLRSTRMIHVVGHNSFRLELQAIYFS